MTQPSQSYSGGYNVKPKITYCSWKPPRSVERAAEWVVTTYADALRRLA